MSIGRPHKEWTLFLCNAKVCGSAGKLPRSSGSFVKDFPQKGRKYPQGIMRPTDRPQFITYAISLMIVCIMCPVMSLVATLLFKEPSFGMWVHTWGCNMPMALCWQMLYCGPLARAIFRLVFRRGEKQAM